MARYFFRSVGPQINALLDQIGLRPIFSESKSKTLLGTQNSLQDRTALLPQREPVPESPRVVGDSAFSCWMRWATGLVMSGVGLRDPVSVVEGRDTCTQTQLCSAIQAFASPLSRAPMLEARLLAWPPLLASAGDISIWGASPGRQQPRQSSRQINRMHETGPSYSWRSYSHTSRPREGELLAA